MNSSSFRVFCETAADVTNRQSYTHKPTQLTNISWKNDRVPDAFIDMKHTLSDSSSTDASFKIYLGLPECKERRLSETKPKRWIYRASGVNESNTTTGTRMHTNPRGTDAIPATADYHCPIFSHNGIGAISCINTASLCQLLGLYQTTSTLYLKNNSLSTFSGGSRSWRPRFPPVSESMGGRPHLRAERERRTFSIKSFFRFFIRWFTLKFDVMFRSVVDRGEFVAKSKKIPHEENSLHSMRTKSTDETFFFSYRQTNSTNLQETKSKGKRLEYLFILMFFGVGVKRRWWHHRWHFFVIARWNFPSENWLDIFNRNQRIRWEHFRRENWWRNSSNRLVACDVRERREIIAFNQSFRHRFVVDLCEGTSMGDRSWIPSPICLQLIFTNSRVSMNDIIDGFKAKQTRNEMKEILSARSIDKVTSFSSFSKRKLFDVRSDDRHFEMSGRWKESMWTRNVDDHKRRATRIVIGDIRRATIASLRRSNDHSRTNQSIAIVWHIRWTKHFVERKMRKVEGADEQSFTSIRNRSSDEHSGETERERCSSSTEWCRRLGREMTATLRIRFGDFLVDQVTSIVRRGIPCRYLHWRNTHLRADLRQSNVRSKRIQGQWSSFARPKAIVVQMFHFPRRILVSRHKMKTNKRKPSISWLDWLICTSICHWFVSFLSNWRRCTKKVNPTDSPEDWNIPRRISLRIRSIDRSASEKLFSSDEDNGDEPSDASRFRNFFPVEQDLSICSLVKFVKISLSNEWIDSPRSAETTRRGKEFRLECRQGKDRDRRKWTNVRWTNATSWSNSFVFSTSFESLRFDRFAIRLRWNISITTIEWIPSKERINWRERERTNRANLWRFPLRARREGTFSWNCFWSFGSIGFDRIFGEHHPVEVKHDEREKDFVTVWNDLLGDNCQSHRFSSAVRSSSSFRIELLHQPSIPIIFFLLSSTLPIHSNRWKPFDQSRQEASLFKALGNDWRSSSGGKAKRDKWVALGRCEELWKTKRKRKSRHISLCSAGHAPFDINRLDNNSDFVSADLS